MTTFEHKVKLFLEQNLHAPVLQYFDPMVFLQYSPVIISDSMIDIVLEWYLEKTRWLTLIDLYYLSCLAKEASVQNIILNKLFEKKEISKKLNLFYTLYDVAEFSKMTGVAYFQRFPVGRISQNK
jgi:hypothetical protein